MLRRRFRRIYEINTRVWLWELLDQHIIRHPTLAEVPESYLRYWQRLGIDAIWLMGVWEPSDYSARIGREDPGMLAAFQRYLNDFTPEDCIGSPYAVRQYVVSSSLGGTEGLQRFRQCLQAANIGLLLDFVPNHTACDHPWVDRHPAYYIQGSHADALCAPSEYFHVAGTAGSTYIAHGRDPFFPPWTDTAQLNYFNIDVHLAMREELLRIAEWCEGVRCDMAMLCLSDIFARTWSHVSTAPPPEFWQPTITTVQQYFPEFCFIAEVYWQREARLQGLGFSLTYDKDVYDALVVKEPATLRQLLRTAPHDLHGCLRFLENHDEARAGCRFTPQQAEAAMLALLTLPGAILFHEGQFEGRRYRTPVQLRRRRSEPAWPEITSMYERLLALPYPLDGVFTPLQPTQAWDNNPTFQGILAWVWWHTSQAWVVVINYTETSAQCWLNMQPVSWPTEMIWLRDYMHDTTYERHRDELQQRGLYIDLPAFDSHLFAVHTAPPP